MKKIILFCLIFAAALSNSGFWFIKEKKMEPMKIAMIVAEKDFKDEEFNKPKKNFDDKGYVVKIVSTAVTARGVGATTLTCDTLLKDFVPDDFDAIIFIGGPGAEQYWNDPAAHEVAKFAVDHNKVLGAICIAPVILANAGVLEGKEATVWYSEAKLLKVRGAVYTGRSVETDGNIVTANGPTAAEEFSKKIIDILSKKRR